MSFIGIVTEGGAFGGSEGVHRRLVVLLSTARLPFFFLYVVAAPDDMIVVDVELRVMVDPKRNKDAPSDEEDVEISRWWPSMVGEWQFHSGNGFT